LIYPRGKGIKTTPSKIITWKYLLIFSSLSTSPYFSRFPFFTQKKSEKSGRK